MVQCVRHSSCLRVWNCCLNSLQLRYSQIRGGTIHFRHRPLHPSGNSFFAKWAAAGRGLVLARNRHEHSIQPSHTQNSHHSKKKKNAKRTTRKRLLFRQRTLLDHTKTSEQQQTITHVTSDGRMDGTVRQVRPRDGRLHPTHAVLPAKRRKTRVSLRGKNHGALKSKYSFNLKYHAWKTFLKRH